MRLFLNPHAAGGTALKKWKTIETDFARRFPDCQIDILDGGSSFQELACQALRSGETEFIAAGGDGTVNLLLNALVPATLDSAISPARLGAVGLGSSNDFHKPFVNKCFIGKIPARLMFDRAVQRDIGCLSFQDHGKTVNRYFLSNASCGVTADANWFFNNPNRILALLKRFSTPLAILFAAVRTIVRYRNFEATLETPGLAPMQSLLTNVAILKNPHVSGSFLYDTPVECDDGAFIINLCEKMSTRELLQLLYSLAKGRFSHLNKTQTWHQSSLTITAPQPFAVEYDGEVVSTSAVTFSVLPQFLQVCHE